MNWIPAGRIRIRMKVAVVCQLCLPIFLLPREMEVLRLIATLTKSRSEQVRMFILYDEIESLQGFRRLLTNLQSIATTPVMKSRGRVLNLQLEPT